MRILKIKECKSITGDKSTAQLMVYNENDENLQGIITVDDLDAIECDFLNNTYYRDCDKCEVLEASKTSKQKHYYVFNPDHGQPKKIYNRYEDALRDAKDIGNKLSECNIHVLEIKTTIKKVAVTHETITENGNVIFHKEHTEGIPF